MRITDEEIETFKSSNEAEVSVCQQLVRCNRQSIFQDLKLT